MSRVLLSSQMLWPKSCRLCVAFIAALGVSTGIRRIPGDFEARIALLTGSGNGRKQQPNTGT